MWRIGFDINASWSSMIGLVDQDANLSTYAGPGHWNDPDMMEVGNGLTDTEGRTHFSMWAILAAPLIAGNDLRSMSAATKATLTNSDVIAVDQDPLGIQGAWWLHRAGTSRCGPSGSRGRMRVPSHC
jgi:alpha-galactosidase